MFHPTLKWWNKSLNSGREIKTIIEWKLWLNHKWYCPGRDWLIGCCCKALLPNKFIRWRRKLLRIYKYKCTFHNTAHCNCVVLHLMEMWYKYFIIPGLTRVLYVINSSFPHCHTKRWWDDQIKREMLHKPCKWIFLKHNIVLVNLEPW